MTLYLGNPRVRKGWKRHPTLFSVDTADSPTRSLGFWDETEGYAQIKPLIHKLYKRIGVYNSQISGKSFVGMLREF